MVSSGLGVVSLCFSSVHRSAAFPFGVYQADCMGYFFGGLSTFAGPGDCSQTEIQPVRRPDRATAAAIAGASASSPLSGAREREELSVTSPPMIQGTVCTLKKERTVGSPAASGRETGFDVGRATYQKDEIEW
ncbi:hypothetical protein CSUI_007143 [Cystoisospora suis]|uniref:Uncharacterized protein n=1 Tax=Cystoisospora suis TaxID=483139 RepID=A0A2C6JWL9_9APIC|nr:hypothetical protein CSUI_007143 [Cystoisospora suis]